MIVVQSLITLIKLLSLFMCSTTHLDEELCLSRYSRSLLLLSSRILTLLFPACQAGTDFAYYSADLNVSILGVV
jgi:hypothetical protein